MLLENFRIPPNFKSGVLSLISQSITKMVPEEDFKRFSSCISLKYTSGVEYVQLRGFIYLGFPTFCDMGAQRS